MSAETEMAGVPESISLWPSEWAAKSADTQDRWTITIPGITLQTRGLAKYRKLRGGEAPSGWRADSPGPYAAVEASVKRRGKEKVRKVTLKTKILDGSSESEVELAPTIFGRGISTVRIKPGSKFSYRFTRLRTTGSVFRMISVLFGVVSAGIAASYSIGDKMSHPWMVVSPICALSAGLIGAVLAGAAPFVSLAADKWFNENDVPD